ncbi:MAG: LAGLIDADG family homing endonuclease [Candidatus Levybacteria bacterium]|nr:LAGLIDADG family homing endonuclease [Candidatus Daviesbacteria bacterium]MBI4079556.1 LAGLIDADG family homing endonuclease [Candidatus Levybacteria bacterium]
MPISTKNVSGAVNQQETSLVSKFFYYTGFCVGELSCSVIRANDKRGRGFYFMPDITISNADLNLLKEINQIVSPNLGNISPIKGGYNLKFRGKRKAEKVFQFFQSYPVITGDLARRKLELLKNILPAIGGNSKVPDREKVIEKCREELKDLKLNGLAEEIEDISNFTDDQKGFFLAGIVDAEGSCGFKKSGLRLQPFFAVAMKDRKIIELIKDFLNCGNIHVRTNDGLYHWETNKISDIRKVTEIFMTRYPCKLTKMKDRMKNLRRTLNDYTPRPRKGGEMI